MLSSTLAPWGLAFIQSYAVEKRLGPKDLHYERIDVIGGAVMTGVIGFFVVVACAATLHRHGQSINDARDAATALRPLAGSFASTLFAAGLLGAALLAAAILPLSTAYSVSESLGREARVEGSVRSEPVFYGTYFGVVAVGAIVVLVPGAPLVPILFLTQALNAVLLLPLLVLMILMARDRSLMGRICSGATRDCRRVCADGGRGRVHRRAGRAGGSVEARIQIRARRGCGRKARVGH